MRAKQQSADEPAQNAKSACNCPTLITKTAHRLGISCQQVFEKALTETGCELSFARAVFAHFVSAEDPRIIPTVQSFCRKAKREAGTEKGHCIGCMGDPKARDSLVTLYGATHPEVAKACHVEQELDADWIEALMSKTRE